jgi:murein DD-endopeptidase MepM/ murein hydrolase activator NlpD
VSIQRAPRPNDIRRLLIDLGSEPALAYANGRSLPDRRQFNWRWLLGTFLTGIAGTALMGGALFAAVDGQVQFAPSAPNPSPPYAQYEGVKETAQSATVSRKGDRLMPQEFEPVRRHLVQFAMTTHAGEKDIVRTVPFVRVFAPLALQRTSRTNDIPQFNPMRIFAEAGTPLHDEPQAISESDGEMSLVTKNFSDEHKAIANDDALDDESALKLVRQTVIMTAGTTTSGTISLPESERAVSVNNIGSTAENITAVPKNGENNDTPLGQDEKEIIVTRNDTLATLLVNAGASLQEARLIIEALSKNFKPGDLHEGQRLRYALSPAPTEANPDRKAILKASIVSGRSTLSTAALDENGHYMAISSAQNLEEGATVAQIERDNDEATPSSTPSLYVSLYETGLRYEMPVELIDELIKVYSYDFDFQRHVKGGDNFEVFYDAEEGAENNFNRGKILFASLTVGGTTKRFYRFKTDDDGIIDFYDENGNSAKKFLMRKPMNGGIFTSPFGFRHHPILGYSRMHTGVDWSAPVGTPIMAAGSGTIVKAGWQSGYGQRVEIQHANGYKTTYNHMSGFGSGVHEGAKIFQGQTVGYVGTTGLSTGSHLHYEVMVNGSFVDPLRIKVPRGRVLEGRTYADFERERDRIDAMMTKALESKQVASN